MSGGPLGSVVVLTDRELACGAGHDVVEVTAMAADAGVGAVVVREKDLAADDRRRLAVAITDRLAATPARVVVASDPKLAAEVGAHGVHLAAADPWPDDATSGRLVLGRSCHDREEAAAARGRADYVTLSPVFPSQSKPGHGPALGAEHARSMVPAGGPATYALGGIRPARVPPCMAAGFDGVVVMGAVMGASDPGRVVRDLVDATRCRP